MNHTSDIGTTGINWRRGALRLWVIASALWCGAVFSIALLEYKNTNSFPAASLVVHVRISDTETWDYPAEWGVQRIRDDLEKRLAALDEKEHEWAALLPASRKAECGAIPPSTPFANQPGDCVKLFFAEDKRVVPSGWESQVTTAPECKNGASSCEPWERNWSNSILKPGSVVTEQGTILQPNGRVPPSRWEIIAAVTPGAIAPPRGVLVLGASLFWAFAGFRHHSP